MAKVSLTQNGGEVSGKIQAYLCIILVALAVAVLGLVRAMDKPAQEPAAQQYRFLQRCESGLTAEYKSTRRLPISEVCGPVNYGDYDVVKDESGAGSGVTE